MAIIAKEINGQRVGFNTETNSYCNLPKDFVDEHQQGGGQSKEFAVMTVEELAVYASENNINIGNATSHSGILKKINEHQQGGGQ